MLDHEAESNRHHREVRAAHAQCRQGEQCAHQSGEQRSSRQRDPDRQLRRRRQDCDRVGTDGVKADVAERHLAGEPDQHVEADAGDGSERHGGNDEYVIAVGEPGCQRSSREQEHEGSPCCGRDARGHARRKRLRDWSGNTGSSDNTGNRRSAAHTLFTPARPNRPCGMIASVTITKPKVRICV